MRILILNHEYPPVGGGAGSACRQTAQALARLGVHVTVVTSAFQNLPRCQLDGGVTVIRVPAIRRRAMEATGAEILSFVVSSIPFVISLITRHRPDLIHAYFGLPGGGIALALRALTGVPYIISFRGRDVHGGRDREAGGIRGLMRLASCVAWRGASALIANSQGLRAIARNVLPGAEVAVIPNGVDTGRFSAAGPRPDEGPVRVLCVGRLEPYKGLSDLLKAVSSSADPAAQRVCLDIVGDGTLRHALPDEARSLGLKDRVRFHGNLSPDAMPEAYRNAHLFVLPSYVEGMPNVILEAMASGLPVIATRIPGSEELIDDGVTGLLVAAGDTAALSSAISRLAQDPGLRVRLGRAARRAAETKSWDAVARAYLFSYEAALGAARAAGARPFPLQHDSTCQA